MGALVSTTLTFAALVSVGVALRAFKLLSSEDARPLNVVIIYAGLPAFVFEAVHGATISSATVKMVAVAWVAFGISLGAAFLVRRVLTMEREREGGFLIASALGNTGYLGYPLVAAWLGAQAVPGAVFSDVFGTVFALVLVGLPIASRFGDHSAIRRHPVKELLMFPAVIALVLAMVLRPVAMPETVSNGLGLLASMVAPLVMISVGLSLTFRAVARSKALLASVVGIKLLVAPLAALGVGSLLLGVDQLQVAVLEAGMPSMMLTYVVGERFGLDTEFIAAAIFVTTVISALTVPLMQWVVTL